MAEDVGNIGSWDVVGWREALAKLIGRPVNTFQDHIRERGEEGEEQKRKKEEEYKNKKREKTPPPQLGVNDPSVMFQRTI